MSEFFADEIADPCGDCGAAAGVMCDCVMEGVFGPAHTYHRGDIVTYASPAYQRNLRVKLTVPIVAPDDNTPAWDAVIVDTNGEEDFSITMFTHVWCKESQIITAE